MAAIRAAHASPLARLVAVAECLSGMASSPGELANHLAFLVLDLTDPEFHELALSHARSFQSELKEFLDDAIKAGELRDCDTARLARLVQELLHGALVNWAIYREGSAREWVLDDLEALLAPYRVAESPRSGGPAKRAGAAKAAAGRERVRSARPKAPEH
jgi:hypothetical protein